MTCVDIGFAGHRRDDGPNQRSLMLGADVIADGVVADQRGAGADGIQERFSPGGSFTDPQYAQAGVTETQARQMP